MYIRAGRLDGHDRPPSENESPSTLNRRNEVFSLSFTNPKGEQGHLIGSPTRREANKGHSKFASNILANLCSITTVNIFLALRKR